MKTGIVLEEEILALFDGKEEYLHGNCASLAIALNRLGAGPLIAVIDYDADLEIDCLMHACVSSGKNYIDIKGFRSMDSIFEDFDYWEPSINRIDKKRLQKIAFGDMSQQEIDLLIEKAIPIAERILHISNQQKQLAENIPDTRAKLRPR